MHCPHAFLMVRHKTKLITAVAVRQAASRTHYNRIPPCVPQDFAQPPSSVRTYRPLSACSPHCILSTATKVIMSWLLRPRLIGFDHYLTILLITICHFEIRPTFRLPAVTFYNEFFYILCWRLCQAFTQTQIQKNV